MNSGNLWTVLVVFAYLIQLLYRHFSRFICQLENLDGASLIHFPLLSLKNLNIHFCYDG